MIWLVAALSLIVPPPAQGGGPPPQLARPAVETLPPAVRDTFTRMYRRTDENPGSAAAAGELAMLLHGHQQLEAAAQWYERARQLDPQSFDWAYGAGLAWMAVGRQEEAIAALRRATQLQPASALASLKLADGLFAAGGIEESAAIYQRMRDGGSRLPQVEYGLGRVEAARGNHAAAARHYESAIDLFEAYGAARYALALVYRRLGEAAKAQAQLAKYEEHKMGAPPLPDPFLDRVDALARGATRHLNAGVALGTDGQIEAAIREHEEAVALDPSLAQAHVHLITLYGRKGDVAAAERHYKAVLALNSHLADAHYNYGVLLAYSGRPEEATEAFRKAIAVNPYYAPAHNNLGQLLERRRRFDEAVEHYRRAVEHDPQYRVARFNLGRTLVATERPAEAIEQFLKILEPPDESTPTYMYALAAAYARAGDLDAARRHALDAQRRAEQFGQHELAATIAKDLEKLKR